MFNSRKIITLFFLLCTFFISSSPVYSTEKVGSWNNTTKLPYFLANHPTINILDKLIITGGSTTFVRSDVISSKISSDGTLTNWNNFPLAPLSQETFWHSSVTKNNFIYVLGGAIYPNNQVNSINYVSRGFLDASGNITGWLPMPPLPQRLAWGGAAVVGNKIYFTGGGTWTSGGNPVIRNSVYMAEIDPSGNLGAWQTLTPLPSPLMQHTLIETGTRLIVMGGTSAIWTPTNKVYSAVINADGTIGSWTENTLYPLKRANRAFMANKVGNNVILAGGWIENGVTDEVYYSEIGADGNTGEWFLSTNKLPMVNSCAGSAIWNDYMYITGGHNGTGDPGNYYDTVWYSKLDITSSLTPTPTSTSTPTPTATSTPTPTLTPTPTPTSSPTPTPTPLPASPIPVVFLPGLGASFNFNEMFLGITDSTGWGMTPGAKVYRNIIKAFKDYPKFYVFYYDWRQSALDSAAKLNDFIKNHVQPANNKVYLIGHSLGGLVSRTCVQKMANNCYAEKLITVGSPHAGAVQIYPLVEAGEIWGGNIVDMAMELLIHYYQRPGETRRETVSRVTPIAKELLPVFNYLYKNGSPIPWTGLSVLNPLLPQLTNLSPLKNLTTTLYGKTYPTYGSITVTNPSALDNILGNWPDGKPLDKNNEDGDATVLAKSAVINDPAIDQFSFDFDHSRIISDPAALQKIFQILNIPFPDISFSPTSDEKDYLIFFAHSPVELSSPDINEDSFINPEMIIIPNPLGKNYTLNLKGLANAYYSLSVGQFFGGKMKWNDLTGQVTPGSLKTLQFNINPQNPLDNPLLDQNGTNTKSFLSATVNEFNVEIRDSNLKKIQQKILLDLLSKVQSTKNYESSLSFLSLLRYTIAVLENQKMLNGETANTYRRKAAVISQELEFLLFLNPKTITKKIASNFMQMAFLAKSAVKQPKLTKNGGLVFLEADLKLAKANENFNQGTYYQAKIYSLEAIDLFIEAKILSK